MTQAAEDKPFVDPHSRLPRPLRLDSEPVRTPGAFAAPAQNAEEIVARDRARRQALVLMVASAVLTIVLLGGAWLVVRSWVG